MLITHNMKNKKLLLGIAWAWLTCLSANAEVKLPAFFSDGMVMQQQTQFMGNSYSQCTGENYNKLG